MTDRRPLATAKEVSEHYQISEETLRWWRTRKQGPRWAKIGHHVRYRWADVEKYFDQRAQGAA